jgi:hypothetical protein
MSERNVSVEDSEDHFKWPCRGDSKLVRGGFQAKWQRHRAWGIGHRAWGIEHGA